MEHPHPEHIALLKTMKTSVLKFFNCLKHGKWRCKGQGTKLCIGWDWFEMEDIYELFVLHLLVIRIEIYTPIRD